MPWQKSHTPGAPSVVQGELTQADAPNILRAITAAGIDASDLQAVVTESGNAFFIRRTLRPGAGNAVNDRDLLGHIGDVLDAAGWTLYGAAGPRDELDVLKRPA